MPNDWTGQKRYGRDIATMMRRVNALEDISCYTTTPGTSEELLWIIPNETGDGFVAALADNADWYGLEVDLDGDPVAYRWNKNPANGQVSDIDGTPQPTAVTATVAWFGFTRVSIATGYEIDTIDLPEPLPSFGDVEFTLALNLGGLIYLDDNRTRRYWRRSIGPATTRIYYETYSGSDFESAGMLDIPEIQDSIGWSAIKSYDESAHVFYKSGDMRAYNDAGTLIRSYAGSPANAVKYTYWIDDVLYMIVGSGGVLTRRIVPPLPASITTSSLGALGSSVDYLAYCGGVFAHSGTTDFNFRFVGTADFTSGAGILYSLTGPGETTENDFGQTEFYKFPTFNTSATLGTPDGGVAIPALDGLDNLGASRENYLDLRTAIEALARTRINAGTGDPFNWTDADADNLYFNAVDRTDYKADAAATAYDWARGSLTNIGAMDIDIGEIDDCLTLLEASALVSDLVCA